MTTEQKQIITEELIRINRGGRKSLKLIYIQGDEILPLWEVDFPVGETKVQLHTPEKGQLTAYALTRVSDLHFWLSKAQIRYWWTDFTPLDGVKTSVRVNGVTYEDSPADIFTAQSVLTLSDKWKEKRLSDWLQVFDQLMNFIKMAPSDLSGKVLPNLQKILQ